MKKLNPDKYYMMLGVLGFILTLLIVVYAFLNNIVLDLRAVFMALFFSVVVFLLNFDYSILNGKRSK